jgi:hypothetical protein
MGALRNGCFLESMETVKLRADPFPNHGRIECRDELPAFSQTIRVKLRC